MEIQVEEQAATTTELGPSGDPQRGDHRKTRDEIRLTLRQRLALLIRGRALLSRERRPGWSGSLPIYAFRCPRHGVQADYPHGYDGSLKCPVCGYSYSEKSQW
ncbi:MAG: hypothetical protein JRI56_08955 [Deltaproteobacteria bacterium]|nr:hypothetical protein [Deltaproteobacteria bacterium]